MPTFLSDPENKLNINGVLALRDSPSNIVAGDIVDYDTDDNPIASITTSHDEVASEVVAKIVSTAEMSQTVDFTTFSNMPDQIIVKTAEKKRKPCSIAYPEPLVQVTVVDLPDSCVIVEAQEVIVDLPDSCVSSKAQEVTVDLPDSYVSAKAKEVREEFQCPKCPSKFFSKSGYYRHVKKCGLPRGGKRKKLSKEVSLRKITKNPKEIKEFSKVRKEFQCPKCPSQFFSKSGYYRHVKKCGLPKGERVKKISKEPPSEKKTKNPKEVDVFSAISIMKPYLSPTFIHEDKGTSRVVYKCPKCPADFFSKSGFYKHIKRCRFKVIF